MQTMTIQYNTIQYNTIQYNTIQYNTIQYNERNQSATQILNGLLSAGIIKVKKSASEKRIEELKQAIREAKAMGEDIRKNGTKGYQTMDDLLAEK